MLLIMTLLNQLDFTQDSYIYRAEKRYSDGEMEVLAEYQLLILHTTCGDATWQFRSITGP